MNTVGLDEAVQEIADASREASKRKRPSPFVFVVGAGVSHPPVPLASQIEQHCREKATEKGVKTAPDDHSPMGRYSYWFGKAYPHAEQRRAYLQGLVESKRVSLANLRLAHLLLENSLTNLVVTPNFDDFLARALRALGHRQFRICDHPRTVDRIDPESGETQVVHVHGNYWFYNQANLSGEIEARAERSTRTAFTMASLLEAIFRKHSPIVVGYSGWERDVIMTALRRRLAGRLGYRMYWFCHRPDGLVKFPDDLDGAEDISFIVPPEPQKPEQDEENESSETGAIEVGTRVSLERIQWKPLRETEITPRERAGVLEAHTVFERLIAELKLEAPEVLRDPLGFFAKRFAEVLPEEGSEPEGVAYSFGSVLKRVRAAQELDQARQQESANLQRVYDAVARSAFEEAIAAAEKVNAAALNVDEKRELVQSIWSAVKDLTLRSERVIVGTDTIIRIVDSLPGLLSEIDKGTMARALVTKGAGLETLGRYEEAVAAYEEVVNRFGEASELVLRDAVARALVNKGIGLVMVGHTDEAIAAYDEVANRFGDASELPLLHKVAKALLNKGLRLGEVGRLQGEIEAYDEVVKRFGDSSEPFLREVVARALANKGFTLGDSGRHDETIAVSDDLLKRFGDASELPLREQVARALVNKGVGFRMLGRYEDVISVCDEVVNRFGDTPELVFREAIGRALLNKGISLEQLRRNEEAIAVYKQAVDRLGKAREAVLAEIVTNARDRVKALSEIATGK